MSLDDDIRKALTALEGTVPDGYFDQLETRLAQRLEEEVAMDVDMTTGKDGDQGTTGTTPPPKKKEENTGLHDIKAMAQSAKRRVSRRITTQTESEEQLLTSSGSMNQVVLPDPNKQVEVDVAPAVDLARSDTQERQSRGGIPVWVYAAVGVVAVAAVVFFVIRGKKGEDKTVARSEATISDGTDTSSPAPPPPGAAANLAPSAEPIDPAGDTGASAEPIAEGTPPADEGAAAGGDAPPAAPSNGGSAERGDRKRDAKPSEVKGGARPDAPKDPKVEAAKPKDAPAPAKKPAGTGNTLEDLLDDATGGPVPSGGAGDKEPAVDPAAPPAKTDISREDISTGMSRVLGRVQGCYDQHKESGTVMIAVTIDPGGSISSASATGKFGGTPTGTCVAEAVKKAKFPSWEGKPKKINYPFLLSP